MPSAFFWLRLFLPYHDLTHLRVLNIIKKTTTKKRKGMNESEVDPPGIVRQIVVSAEVCKHK